MIGPQDFGLSPLDTLARVGDPTPAAAHGPYWNKWVEEVWARQPALDPPSSAARDLGATHSFESVRSVRIAVRLIEPPGAERPRGVVLSTHGYHAEGGFDDAGVWADRPLAVCRLRLRGFPASHEDTGLLTSAPGGWITHGLPSKESWILRAALADVVNAFRALRARYGPDMPISLHGESLGGGLAVLAAAQLASRDRVFRLALALPSLGDWPWRLARSEPIPQGIGADVARFLLSAAGVRDEARETLRLFDPVVHARRIASPVICKLAERDEVVPAPTAAAVFNVLGASPGLKWRFVTRYGHFDAGLADARRHALFERLIGAFLDPAEDVAALMADWSPVLHRGERAPV